MNQAEQTQTPWKRFERQERQTRPEGELLRLPEKPQNVIEFEDLKEESKKRIRESDEWAEIKRYYDRYQDIIQHNGSIHAYRMKMGLEPIGKVQYVGKTFVQPIHSKIPKDEQWEKGPDGIFHPPSCDHRLSGYQNPMECHCGKRREREIFKKIKETVTEG